MIHLNEALRRSVENPPPVSIDWPAIQDKAYKMKNRRRRVSATFAGLAVCLAVTASSLIAASHGPDAASLNSSRSNDTDATDLTVGTLMSGVDVAVLGARYKQSGDVLTLQFSGDSCAPATPQVAIQESDNKIVIEARRENSSTNQPCALAIVDTQFSVDLLLQKPLEGRTLWQGTQEIVPMNNSTIPTPDYLPAGFKASVLETAQSENLGDSVITTGWTIRYGTASASNWSFALNTNLRSAVPLNQSWSATSQERLGQFLCQLYTSTNSNAFAATWENNGVFYQLITNSAAAPLSLDETRKIIAALVYT